MENVFEELLTDSTAVDDTENSAESEDFDHTFDLTDNDMLDEEQIVDDADNGADEKDVDDNPSEPTNNAFAQMRTQNKEYQNKLQEFDDLAKQLGMKDADEFIKKAKEAQVKREATKKGIPLEVAQELEEMRSLKDSIIAEREQSVTELKTRNFVSNLQEFVNANQLSEQAVDKLSQDLEKDGFELDSLMAMPKAALNRILGAYVGTNYQKNLERKNTIRKELPINQSSKIDTKSLNKDIDTLAKQLAGKF